MAEDGVEKLPAEVKSLTLQLREARNTAEEAVKECEKWKGEAEDVRNTLHDVRRDVGAKDDSIQQLQRKYMHLTHGWGDLTGCWVSFHCTICSGYVSQFYITIMPWLQRYPSSLLARRESINTGRFIKKSLPL